MTRVEHRQLKPIGLQQETVEQGIYDDEERVWIMAVEQYRKVNRVRFPSAVDLLRLAKRLGYSKG